MRYGIDATTYRNACDLLQLEPIAGVTPSAREQHLPSWLHYELLKNDGRRKLASWAERTPVARRDEPVDRSDLFVRLHFHGDTGMAAITIGVLSKLPRPVCDYVSSNVTFLGVGIEVAGTFGPPIDFSGHPGGLITVSGSADKIADAERIVAHEAAHAWLKPPPPPGMTVLPAAWSYTVNHAVDVPDDLVEMVTQARTQYQQDEDDVHALLRVWGYE